MTKNKSVDNYHQNNYNIDEVEDEESGFSPQNYKDASTFIKLRQKKKKNSKDKHHVKSIE